MMSDSKNTGPSEDSSVENPELKDSQNTEESSQTLKEHSRIVNMNGKGPRLSVEIVGGVRMPKKKKQ